MTDRLFRDDVKGPAAAKPGGCRALVLAGCFLLVGLLGWLDYVTGYEMSFFVFYSVLDRRHALAAELQATRETLRIVSALLPTCPACGKPRDRAEGNRETEFAALACVAPELAGTLCTDCSTNGAKAVPTTPAGWSAA